MKSRICLFLALLLPAIGGSVAIAQQADQPYEVIMSFFSFYPTPPDIALVEAEINKITVPKIGATLKLRVASPSTYFQQLNLILASDEKLDLIADGTIFSITGRIARNQLLPLDDLLAKQGKGIVDTVTPQVLEACRFNGKIYGATTMRDFASGYGYAMRKDIVDKYGIDVRKIKSYADITAVLKLVKSKEPSITPLINGTGSSFLSSYRGYDGLGDGMGVLLDMGAKLKVENWYETAEYKSLVKLIRSWYQSGYILKDAATNTDSVYSLMKAGKAFSYFCTTNPDVARQESIAAGAEMVIAELVPYYSQSRNVNNFLWAIPRNSKDPAKAMQMLNLLYTDPKAATLLVYGIEGRHYVRTADGHIDYPAGVDENTSSYTYNQTWSFPNQLLLPVWKGYPLDHWKRLDDVNKKSPKSKAMGFVFDGVPVKAAFTAVQNVASQYSRVLECGSVDPDTTLPEFLAKLKKAGIDKIIAEKQRQLDQWAATHKN